MKQNQGNITLGEALAQRVKLAEIGWKVSIIFKCERCRKPQEYPAKAEGHPVIMCCYCPHYNVIEKVSIKLVMT